MKGDEPRIFISHTQADEALAHALRDATRALLGESVVVSYSTNKELVGGIKPGEDWFRWIGEQVRDSKIALILLTPSSVQKPWVLWEGGAVAGVALSSEGSESRKLRPITYNLRTDEIPGPFGRKQITDGLNEADVLRLFEDMLSIFGLEAERLIRAARLLEEVKTKYLWSAKEALRLAPMIVTEAAVQEWVERINDLDRTARFSEAEELRDWMNVAFGRDAAEGLRPLDLRIHRRLGELYAKAGKSGRAASEFELARQLAPRDIYVLRRLGKAHLDGRAIDEAGRVISAIGELDPRAFVRNVENVALKARWHREQGDHDGASTVLRQAFEANPKSYYIGDLLGQSELSLGDRASAEATYQRVLAVIDGLQERNVWSLATGLTAAIVVGDVERQEDFLSSLGGIRPSPEDAKSILDGIARIALSIETAASIKDRLLIAFTSPHREI